MKSSLHKKAASLAGTLPGGFFDLSFRLGEERLHVAIEEITGDAFRDDRFVGLESIEVAFTHLGGDFEADVKELADVGVVAWVALVVR